MSNIGNIFNAIMCEAFEATSVKNPFASFTYPYIIKKEILKYFKNKIDNSIIFNKDQLNFRFMQEFHIFQN